MRQQKNAHFICLLFCLFVCFWGGIPIGCPGLNHGCIQKSFLVVFRELWDARGQTQVWCMQGKSDVLSLWSPRKKRLANRKAESSLWALKGFHAWVKSGYEANLETKTIGLTPLWDEGVEGRGKRFQGLNEFQQKKTRRRENVEIAKVEGVYQNSRKHDRSWKL